MKLELQLFLTLTVDGGEWSATVTWKDEKRLKYNCGYGSCVFLSVNELRTVTECSVDLTWPGNHGLAERAEVTCLQSTVTGPGRSTVMRVRCPFWLRLG